MYQRKHPFRVLARHGTSRGKENDAPIAPIRQVYGSMISDAYGGATTPLNSLSLDEKVDRVLCKLENVDSKVDSMSKRMDGLDSKVDSMRKCMDGLGENVGLLIELHSKAVLTEARLVDPANADYYSHFECGEARLSLELKSLADLGRYLQLDDKEIMSAFTHVMNGYNAKGFRVILEAFVKKAHSDISKMQNGKSKEKCLSSVETFQALVDTCKDILLAWNLAAPARRVLKVYGQSSKHIKFIFPVIEEAAKVLKEVHTCAESLSVNVRSVFPFAFLAYQARKDLVSRLEIDLAGDCIREGAGLRCYLF